MNDTFLNGVDVGKVEEVIKSVNDNSKYFNDVCSGIVKEYSESLDGLMSDIYVSCVRDNDVSMETLQSYYLELSNMIYFMNERLEALGVKSSMAESAYKEVYSKNVIIESKDKDEKGKSKVTVSELQAKAALGAQYENVVSSIYDHAYKVVKGKVSSAQDMMNTLRRIISSRTEEMRLSSNVGGQN